MSKKKPKDPKENQFGNWEVVFGNWELYSETGSYIRKLETAYSETARKEDGYY